MDFFRISHMFEKYYLPDKSHSCIPSKSWKLVKCIQNEHLLNIFIFTANWPNLLHLISFPPSEYALSTVGGIEPWSMAIFVHGLVSLVGTVHSKPAGYATAVWINEVMLQPANPQTGWPWPYAHSSHLTPPPPTHGVPGRSTSIPVTWTVKPASAHNSSVLYI